MNSNETQPQEHQPIEDSEAEQTFTNKVFRIGCMTFCLAVTVLFLWVWHHQTQFNDNYREAGFHMRNGEPEKAIAAYKKAIRNKKRTLFFRNSPSAYNNLGRAYLYTKQYAEAVENLKVAIEMAPDVVEGHINLMTAYLQQNLPAAARKVCLEALQTFPNTALLHYNLACAYALEDKPQKALDSLRQAVALEPKIKDFAQAEGTLKDIVPQLP